MSNPLGLNLTVDDSSGLNLEVPQSGITLTSSSPRPGEKVCKFIPQTWNPAKCKICFKTKSEHTSFASPEEVAAAASVLSPPPTPNSAGLLSPRMGDGSAGECKFIPQLFNKLKCKTCFKSRDGHKYFSEEENSLSSNSLASPSVARVNLLSPLQSGRAGGNPWSMQRGRAATYSEMMTPKTLTFKQTGIDERAEAAADNLLMDGLDESDQVELRMLLEEERLLTAEEASLEEQLKRVLKEEEEAASSVSTGGESFEKSSLGLGLDVVSEGNESNNNEKEKESSTSVES